MIKRRLKKTGLNVLAVCSLGFASAGLAGASQFVLILHNDAGWQFQGAEKLTINGKTKLRRGASGGSLELTQDAYKKLPQEALGGALRLHRGGYLVTRNGATWTPIFPDGANFKGSSSAQAIWSAAQVVIQADRGSKDQAMRTSDIFAILSGPATPIDAAVTYLSDEENFRGVGEPSPAASFDERMSLLTGIAAVATGPSQAKIKAILSDPMNRALKLFSSAGTGRYAALTEGLRYVPVAEKAFPADAELTRLGSSLREKLDWLNQRTAIVRALGVATEWDALIDKYDDLKDYDDAFNDLRELYNRSARESEAEHTKQARDALDATPKRCATARDEIKLAMLRNPSSGTLEALYSEIRIGCLDDHTGGTPAATETSAQKLRIVPYITRAERDIAAINFDAAEDDLKAAEAVYARDPKFLLSRIHLLQAQKHLKQAISKLDDYEVLVKDDSAALEAAASLRENISYDIRSGSDAARKANLKAEADGDYPAALVQARAGLQINDSDPELLYHAGLDAAVTRNEKEARAHWGAYLSIPPTQLGSSNHVTEVRNDLILLSPLAEPVGAPNWYSGRGNPPGLMYDPASLAINVHPTEVKGSRKLQTVFEWRGNVLNAVHTTLQEPIGAPPVNVYFDYYPSGHGVRRVSTELFDDKSDPGPPKVTPQGAAGQGKGTYVTLFTDPNVNPYLIEVLAKKRVATIVAGNPYFNPFVWNGVFAFIAEYDADGRVKSATPVKSGLKALEFQWDGNKLVSIAEKGGGYRREMKYNGAQLIGEVISYNGKTSKIEYRYNGGRLVEAHCDDDSSIDGRSRQVVFGN